MSRSALFAIAFAATLAAAACTTAPPTTPAPGTPAAGTPGATSSAVGARLAAVKSRDQLICGVNTNLAGFAALDQATNTWIGFDADFCRAVAAAVLGDASKVEFRGIGADDRSTALQSGSIDVLIRNTTWTSSRDATWGNFGPTTFYDGQGMMVNSTRTDATTLEELAGATICVQTGTTTELNLADQMRVRGVEYEPLTFDNIDAAYAAYSEGRCDAVTSDRSQLVGRRSAFPTPDDHVLLEVVMSKEPLGPAVPAGDDQWFDAVKWVVFATIQAEESGIDSTNVTQMRDTATDPVIKRLLGVQPDAGTLASAMGLDDAWVVNVISAVGNYEEIFNRNLGPDTPLGLDRGLNQLWTDGGLLYAPPYR